MYARFGIPIAFFTTGSHLDYHQLTDEPQYIDFDKMARVTRLIGDGGDGGGRPGSPDRGGQAEAGSGGGV